MVVNSKHGKGQKPQTNKIMEEREIDSLGGYIEFVHKFRNDLVIFRGQREDKPLLPKIDRIGLGDNLITKERDMLDEFKRTSRPFLDTKPETEWDWLAIAQHHGMATRLLDWTEIPVAALWFAVEKPPIIDKKTKKTQGGVVWVCKVNTEYIIDLKLDGEKDPLMVLETMVFRPNHITPRIIAQKGWFTVHKYRNKNNEFISLEKQLRYKEFLTKIKIPGDVFFDIRKELNYYNVNNASLFPDLDGICRHIVWSNSGDEKINDMV